MKRIRAILQFFIGPVITGSLVAFVLVFYFPKLIQPSPQVSLQESTHDLDKSLENTLPQPVVTSYADSVEIASPAVVNIYTTKVVYEQNPFRDDPLFRFFFGDNITQKSQKKQRLLSSLGSGVIVSKEGYVITNNHVIAGADEVLVALKDKREVKATLIGTDPETDVAVLKINLPDLPIITLSENPNLRVGDVVLAIGNPFGVGQTVTLGIISATGRNQLGLNTFEDFIQTDAAINPGNSGGALVNAHGELVGINTAIFSKTGGSQGIGFAIPTSLAKQVLLEIIKNGQVIRGWLGIEIQSMTPQLAKSFDLKDTKSVIIAGIYRNSPAFNAGLQPGDIITELNSKPIQDATDAIHQIAKTKPGTQVNLSLIRNGEALNIQVEVATRPKK